ncbi:MASE1 domain-containing protein [Thermoleptolyngbya sichuanensis XZ-Cy5]|uniref:MASE1 domain-containing protein n=1 Tax=Thermoleptolyngbya sichuanensis TaxID=2885951 RepID=UPI00240DBA63|nr:MASE1 domain-containing protein [Thermoleptolyngbya sichuanensis XZ-Cy5]
MTLPARSVIFPRPLRFAQLSFAYVWKQGAVAVAYYAAAQFSIAYATLPDAASTPVWFAGGIAVGAMLAYGVELWLGIFASILVLEFIFFKGWESTNSLMLAIAVTFIATLGKVIAAVWSDRLTQSRSPLDSPADVVRFILAAFLSHLPIGMLCAALVCNFGKAPWAAYRQIFITWWLSDAFGIVLVAPLLLAWSSTRSLDLFQFRNAIRRHWLEAVAMAALVIGISEVALVDKYPVEYLLIPVIVWAAFRFRSPGATLVMVLLSLLAVISTAKGLGSFARSSMNESLLLLQSCIAAIALTTLLLCAVLYQNDQSKQALRDANHSLEDRVQQRTAELAQANAAIVDLNERLKQENLRMAAELDVVRQIQGLILPTPEELSAIQTLDVSALTDLTDEDSTDYFDVVETDGIVTLSVGIVGGRGLESGVLMLMVQTAVRTLAELRDRSSVRFLQTLNRTLYKNIERLSAQQQQLTLAVLNYLNGSLSVSGQHEDLVVVRASGRVERVSMTDLILPLGLEFDITAFTKRASVELQPGDGIVLYTSSLPSALDENGVMYGLDRLYRVVGQYWAQPASAVHRAIIQDVRQHMRQENVLDNLSLLVLKRRL